MTSSNISVDAQGQRSISWIYHVAASKDPEDPDEGTLIRTSGRYFVA